MTSRAPLLLYDGDCAFCAGSVRFLLDRDRTGPARFAARGGDTGRAVLARHPDAAASDSLVWLPDGAAGAEALVRYRAVLGIGRYLGGVWAALAIAGRIVPTWLGDRAYDLVARHRHRLAGPEACVVFTPDERRRVLD